MNSHTIGMCRTCLSVAIRVHNVSQQPGVFDLDGAIFVTFNRCNSQSKGLREKNPGYIGIREDKDLSWDRMQYIIRA